MGAHVYPIQATSNNTWPVPQTPKNKLADSVKNPQDVEGTLNHGLLKIRQGKDSEVFGIEKKGDTGLTPYFKKPKG